MVDATIERELTTCLGRLAVEQQRRVLEFARTLAAPPAQGVPGSTLLRFAGRIDESELDALSEAIEDGCERMDAEQW